VLYRDDRRTASSRSLSYKSAFVLLQKLREAMAEEMKGRVVGGEGKTAEVDGGYFGGYVTTSKKSALIVVSLGTKTVSVGLLS